MKKTIVLIVIVLYFFSCNTEPKEENHKTVEKKNTIVEKFEEEHSSEEEPEPEPDIEILDTIKKHCLGDICTGTPIKKVLTRLKERYIVYYDSIAQSEEDTLYFYHYAVLDKKSLRLFDLNTKENHKENDTINTIMVISDQFITEKGISVGDKVTELKSKYAFEKAYFTYDEGLWLYFSDFKGAFRLDLNTVIADNLDVENPNLSIDSIPGKIKIDGIVIY